MQLKHVFVDGWRQCPPCCAVFKSILQHTSCLGGDGTTAQNLQIYIKKGLAFTPAHDELNWSCALNRMMSGSRGVALWIGFNLHEARAKGINTIRLLAPETTGTETDIRSTVRMLARHKVKIHASFQRPDKQQTVVSSEGNGDVHMVLAVGDSVAIAWNLRFLPQAMRRCVIIISCSCKCLIGYVCLYIYIRMCICACVCVCVCVCVCMYVYGIAVSSIGKTQKIVLATLATLVSHPQMSVHLHHSSCTPICVECNPNGALEKWEIKHLLMPCCIVSRHVEPEQICHLCRYCHSETLHAALGVRAKMAPSFQLWVDP
jgi:hypothetical protein